MALQLIHMEPHAKILTMNHMSDILLPFAFHWTGNRMRNLVTLHQNHMHVEESQRVLIGQLITRQKHNP